MVAGPHIPTKRYLQDRVPTYRVSYLSTPCTLEPKRLEPKATGASEKSRDVEAA